MGKDTAKSLVGQPIFKHVMKILPKEKFDLLVKQCDSDRYYKWCALNETTSQDGVSML